ncbi:MAG: hypothetical protein RIS94_157 [Pseudomonadota bacterium]
MTTVDRSRFRPTPVLRPRRRKLLTRVHLVDAQGNTHDVAVENVSTSGVQALSASATIAVGDPVTLHLSDGQALWGVVRWRDGHRFGMELDTAAAPPPAQGGTGGQSMCLRPTRK